MQTTEYATEPRRRTKKTMLERLQAEHARLARRKDEASAWLAESTRRLACEVEYLGSTTRAEHERLVEEFNAQGATR